jgi:hypothetical protein
MKALTQLSETVRNLWLDTIARALVTGRYPGTVHAFSDPARPAHHGVHARDLRLVLRPRAKSSTVRSARGARRPRSEGVSHRG